MASIDVVKKAIIAGRKSNVGIWLWGPHGVGKSETVATVAKELGIEMINIRAALTEAGDWMGLPVADVDQNGDKVVKFHISTFLPQDPNWKGIIFLDELNRARLDVVNCVFQLTLERCIVNHYTLPAGASIVAAGNPADDDYQVTDVDPALMGRFCHLQVTPSAADWVDWAREHGGVRKDIIKYINSNKKMLAPAKRGNLDLKLIQPNERSWTMLSKMTDALEQQGTIDECLIDVATGLVGTAGGTQYPEFRRKNYAVIDIQKVLFDYEKVRPTVKEFTKRGEVPEQAQAIDELFEFLGDKPKTVEDDKVYDNLMTFFTDLAKDTAYMAGRQMMNMNDETLSQKLWAKIDEGHKPSLEFQKLIMELDKIERKANDAL